VKAILEKPGVKLDVVDTSQMPSTPLSLAVGQSHEEIVKQLLDAGADPRKYPVARECYEGVNRGILGIIRSLISHGLSVDYAENTGNTFLHSAATYGNLDAVRMLLSCDANVAVANVNGVIPLYRAAEDNYLDVARLLLPKMRSPGACDAATRYGATSLHAAAKKNYIEFARLLIKHGAGLDVQDNEGNTPLHAAAFRGLKDMVWLLLQAGARVRIRNSEGIRPSEGVDGGVHTELKRILEKAEYDRARSGAEGDDDDDGDSSSDSIVVHYPVYWNQDMLLPGSRSAAH
jgi:ankyrin repeat protein